LRQVCGLDVDLNAILRSQLIRNRREPGFIARHDCERVTEGGELARELQSDAG
jgi:hypothetical protein